MEQAAKLAPRFFCGLISYVVFAGIGACRLTIGFNKAWMKIIQNNPYRLLGVYANSTAKERLGNCNKMKAFLKVGKTVQFPLDLPQLMPAVDRTEETVADAEAKLTLPPDQVRYAQFWFVNMTSLDEVAFSHLTAGDIAKAEEIWQKRDCASSLQNRIVCALLRKQYSLALSCAEILYENPRLIDQFVSAIIGAGGNVKPSSAAFSFIDAMCDEVGAGTLLQYKTNNAWKAHISEKAITPLISYIQSAIDAAKRSRTESPQASLEAGETLKKSTESSLAQLRTLLPATDVQYQVTADKLGLEILDCGIAYYNGSDGPEATYKAYALMKSAQSIVVGPMAKDRCDKNVRTLDDAISKLPPKEVMPEYNAIRSCLAFFMTQPQLIMYAQKLLIDCVPYVVAIKEKLGKGNKHYLAISTRIVNHALGYVISEVNKAQEKKDFEILKIILIEAWRTQLFMDKYDLESEFKNGRFKRSRNDLQSIIGDLQGFKNAEWSYMYKHGCGWCNDLDDSEVDLCTEDECYSSCRSIKSYKAYIKKYPQGKHVAAAMDRIEQLIYNGATTINELESFIQQYPHSKYVVSAKNKIVSLRFKVCKTIADYGEFIKDYPNSEFVPMAKEAIDRITRQEKALAQCLTTVDVIALYNREKSVGIDVDKCSLLAFSLSYDESDYMKVMNTFGPGTPGGAKAKQKLSAIADERKRKAYKRRHVIKWSILLVITIVACCAAYLMWGTLGVASASLVFALILLAITVIGFNEGLDQIVGFSTTAVLAIVFIVSFLNSKKEIMPEPEQSFQNSQTENTSRPEQSTSVSANTSNDYKYIDNQLATGAKPYDEYYISRTGRNYIDISTVDDDCVVIARSHSALRVVNHIYVKAYDVGRLYLPDGTYAIYFYGGKGWNPHKEMGDVVGGFVSDEHVQKDDPIKLYGNHVEYTLWLVEDGNLNLEESSTAEAL